MFAEAFQAGKQRQPGKSSNASKYTSKSVEIEETACNSYRPEVIRTAYIRAIGPWHISLRDIGKTHRLLDLVVGFYSKDVADATKYEYIECIEDQDCIAAA